MHLLHERKNFLNVGDIIRIGNIKGRDYTVAFMDYKTQTAFPYMVLVEPTFSMLVELDFDAPTTGNNPFPKSATLEKHMRKFIPKTAKQLGAFHISPHTSHTACIIVSRCYVCQLFRFSVFSPSKSANPRREIQKY